MGVLGYFGDTENGTSGVRIKILRPLFYTNIPPKTPIQTLWKPEKQSGAYMIYYRSKTLGPTWCSQHGDDQGAEGRRTSLGLGAHRAPWWQNCFQLLFKTFLTPKHSNCT